MYAVAQKQLRLLRFGLRMGFESAHDQPREKREHEKIKFLLGSPRDLRPKWVSVRGHGCKEGIDRT